MTTGLLAPHTAPAMPTIVGMDFGVGYLPTHDGIGPGPLARAVEGRGQDALFFAEHTHIPASRRTPAVVGLW